MDFTTARPEDRRLKIRSRFPDFDVYITFLYPFTGTRSWFRDIQFRITTIREMAPEIRFI